MLGLLAFALSTTAVIIGFTQAKEFVARRLRYVDAARSPLAPIVAGIGAALIAAPIVWLLPLVGAGSGDRLRAERCARRGRREQGDSSITAAGLTASASAPRAFVFSRFFSCFCQPSAAVVRQRELRTPAHSPSSA